MDRVGVIFFAVVANKKLGLKDLNDHQLLGIFVSQPRGYVAVGRPAGSGTRAAFEEKVLGSQFSPFPSTADCPTPSGSTALRPTACTKDTTMDSLAYVNQVPNAIGYAEADALPFFPNVEIVPINGQEPTRDAVISGQYPFVATQHLYTVGQPSDLVQDFIGYLMSNTITTQLRDRDFVACADLPGGTCPTR